MILLTPLQFHNMKLLKWSAHLYQRKPTNCLSRQTAITRGAFYSNHNASLNHCIWFMRLCMHNHFPAKNIMVNRQEITIKHAFPLGILFKDGYGTPRLNFFNLLTCGTWVQRKAIYYKMYFTPFLWLGQRNGVTRLWWARLRLAYKMTSLSWRARLVLMMTAISKA